MQLSIMTLKSYDCRKYMRACSTYKLLFNCGRSIGFYIKCSVTSYIFARNLPAVILLTIQPPYLLKLAVLHWVLPRAKHPVTQAE